MKRTVQQNLPLIGALLLASQAFGQGYRSNDLTPPGATSGKFVSTSGGHQVGTIILGPSAYAHAVLESGNALGVVDLNPPNFYYSVANCSDDSQQAGWGYGIATGGTHALVWNGSASSYADLHPSGYMFSECLGVHSGEQVGYAQNQSYFITASHAYCWYGSAGSGVDLHPIQWGYPFSRAKGVHSGEEVGYVSTVGYPEGDYAGYHTTSRAVRWTGSAASAVDLHPVGFDASEALCSTGTQQGGWAYTALGTNHMHAMLWSGDAASAVDLHPAGYADSKITSLTATQQVGEGWVGPAFGYGSVRHALAWTGTADSVVDLNQYLPAGYTNAVATGVDANGNIVGYAYNGSYVGGFNMWPGSIAVVFAPGANQVQGLQSLSLSSAKVVPGASVTATVTLGTPAPAGGTSISFLSSATNLVPTPDSIVIPEGETNIMFTFITGGTTLTYPTSLKLYATDGVVSSTAQLTLTPVVTLSSLSANLIEGGFSTYATVSLNIPAQGVAAVSVNSGNTALATVPATVTVPSGYLSSGFSIATAPVSTVTTVPITASFNGSTISTSLTLSPAPVVSLSAIAAPEMVGGFQLPVTVSVNNFPRAAGGAVVTLTSGDTGTLQVPATVTIPYGMFSATVMANTTVVSGRKGVSLKAAYNGSTLSTTVFVNPVPTVTIAQADYLTDTKMLKIQASTTFTNAILTYGTSPDLAPLGTMQFELGVFKGSIILDTAPTQATVWNSLGGFATVPVNIKTSSAATGGGGGGGGGGSTATSYKLSIVTTGKGSVTTSPSGTSFAPGTVVTLTATPAAGSPWIGWTGGVTSTSKTITVTMNSAISVTANFK